MRLTMLLKSILPSPRRLTPLGWFAKTDQVNQLTDAVWYSIFETTIRYLGGLLSTYELTDRQYPKLLEQAKILGDKMAYGWVGVRFSLVW